MAKVTAAADGEALVVRLIPAKKAEAPAKGKAAVKKGKAPAKKTASGKTSRGR